MSNLIRQMNYLIANGFTLDPKTQSYIKNFDNVGQIQVPVIMGYAYKSVFAPYKNFVYSVETLRKVWYEMEKVDDDLDKLKLNGCI